MAAGFPVLLVLLLVLGFFKLSYSLQTQLLYPEHDGGYYTNVAANVRDGNGLTTNISLYHKAYSGFPHRTSVYPLWPLLYGLAGRWLPLLKVGVWLPTLLYFAVLMLAYFWAERAFAGPLLEGMAWLRPGHVLVLMLGLQQSFFKYTSLPYTEGLAYALLFAALWRTWPGWRRPGLGQGLELGAWLGMLLLARGQLVVVAIAAFGALLWALLVASPRAGRLTMLLGAATVFGAIAVGYRGYLSTFVDNAGWLSLLRFDLNRESDLLSRIPVLVHVDGVVGWVVDRASGFLVAFSPRGPYSYAQGYQIFQYAAVVAAPLLVLEVVRWLGPTRRRRARDWLLSPRSPEWLFLVLFAVGGFLSIHAIHKAYSREWNFGMRHALISLPLFYLALVYLLRSGRRGIAVLGLCLTLAGSALGFVGLAHTIRALKEADPVAVGRGPWKPELAAWLREREREHGGLTVAMSYGWPQRLALSTPGVNYHWIYWETTLEDVTVLFEKLGVQYLLIPRGSRPKPNFLSPREDFFARFERIERNLDGFQIFAQRHPGPTP
jgi:hypothetical protein